MSDREYSEARLKNLFHYVIWAAGSRPHFGATKLYKVAWFSDARSYVLRGHSITGAPYIREKHGPIPRDGIRLRNEMAEVGRIVQRRLKQFDFDVWQFKANSPPEVDWFDDFERQQIDYWVRHIGDNHTAGSISDESHDFGWEIARIGEPLPFYSVLADRVKEPSGADLEWAKRRARELELP